MNRLKNIAVAMVIGAQASAAEYVMACPTCKDSLTEQYVQAYGLSIVFMMSMPFLIFGGLACYFYWEVRKARTRQMEEAQSESPETAASPAT